MGRQLFVALIAPVDRQEKRVGVRDMKHHGDPQLRRFIEDGSKPFVVDSQQVPGPIADAQSKIFPEFDALGSMIHEPFETIERRLDKVVLFHAGPVHPTDRGEAFRVGLMEFVNDPDGLIACLHGDVDDALNVAGVHDAQDVEWVERIQVIVIVNHREACALHVMLDSHQSGLRLKLAERKGHFSFRRDHGHEVVVDFPAGFGHLATFPGKECRSKKFCTRSLSRNASVPPTPRVESAPVTFPAYAHALGGKPLSQPNKNPALKLSPAPIVSTGCTDTPSTINVSPATRTTDPRDPHLTAMQGTRASSARASSNVFFPVMRQASPSFGSSRSTNSRTSGSTPPHSPLGSSLVSSEMVKPASFNSLKSAGTSGSRPRSRNRDDRWKCLADLR